MFLRGKTLFALTALSVAIVAHAQTGTTSGGVRGAVVLP